MSFAFASFRRALPSVTRRFSGNRSALAAVGLSLAGACHLSAQTPGTLDTSFLAVETGITFYTQVLENVDGTPVLFIGGDQDGLNEFVIQGRSSTGGSLAGADYDRFGDEGLGPDIGNPARIIYTAVPELAPHAGNTAPQILVGGLFGRSATQINNMTPGQNIFRLDPFANVDPTFNPGKGADDYVTSILPLADGGMVVGGEFQQFNKIDHLRIVRLDSTGAIVPDSTFDTNLTFDATVLALDAQLLGGVRNGQILVAGQFSNVNGKTYNKLARLNADGSVDASFHPSFDDRTTIVKSQPDGKILVGGDFENVSGTAAKHIVRLNYDGSVDSTFTAQVTGMPAGFANPPAVYVIQQLPDGSMYLGGNFTTVNGVTRNYLAKVDATGALDTAFDPGTTIINAVQSIVVQTDGKLLIGETVSRTLEGGKIYPPSLIRLYGEAPSINITTASDAVIATAHNGAFTLTRNIAAPTSDPLSVFLLIGGNAHSVLGTKPKSQIDYDFSATGLVFYSSVPAGSVYEVTFAANQTSITIPIDVKRLKSYKKRDSRDVILTLVGDQTGDNNYVVGPDASATVTISND